MATTILKPGLLVSLHTEVRGGVKYERRDMEGRLLDDKSKVDKWETTRVIADPADYEKATKLRSAARNLVARVCTPSQFGLLCSEANEAELDEAVKAARELCDAHNDVATTTAVGVYVLKGRIAATDDEAARAIASEVRGLLDTMRSGILAGDIEAIREAASKTKKLGAMLDPSTATKVGAAVEAARTAAREIVKRVKVGTEKLPDVLSQLKLDELDAKRFSCLDLDDAVPVESLPVVVSGGLDIDDEEAEPARRENEEPQVLAASGE